MKDSYFKSMPSGGPAGCPLYVRTNCTENEAIAYVKLAMRESRWVAVTPFPFDRFRVELKAEGGAKALLEQQVTGR